MWSPAATRNSIGRLPASNRNSGWYGELPFAHSDGASSSEDHHCTASNTKKHAPVHQPPAQPEVRLVCDYKHTLEFIRSRMAVLSRFNTAHSDVLLMQSTVAASRLRVGSGFAERRHHNELFTAPLSQTGVQLLGVGGATRNSGVTGGFQQLRDEVNYHNTASLHPGGNASRKRRFHQVDADGAMGRFLTSELHSTCADATALVPARAWDSRDAGGSAAFKLPPPPNTSAWDAVRNDTQLVPFSIIRPYNPTSLPHVGRPRFIEGVTDDAERKRRHDHRVRRRVAQCRWPEGKLSFELRRACSFPHICAWFPYVNTTEKLLFARYYKMVDHFDYVQNFVAAELQCNHCSLSRIITGEYPYQTKAIFVKRFRAWIFLVDRSVSMTLQQHIQKWDATSGTHDATKALAAGGLTRPDPVLATAVESAPAASAGTAVAVRAVIVPPSGSSMTHPRNAVEETLISNELIGKVASQLDNVTTEELTSWFECTMDLERRSQVESKLLGFFKSYTYEQTRMEIPLASSTLQCGRLTHGIPHRQRQQQRNSNREGRHAKQLRDEAEDDAMSSVFIAAAQELVEQRDYRYSLTKAARTRDDGSESLVVLLETATAATIPPATTPPREVAEGAPILRALRSASKQKP